MKNEFEATYLSIDKEDIRIKLKSNGFTLKYPEYMMRRKTLDFPNKILGVSKWGRVRQEFSKVTMTIKEVRGVNIKDIYEVELIVDDFDNAIEFLVACGLYVKSFQENRRELWIYNDIEVTIDTWPGLNPFLEIEGPNENKVKEFSQKLGFDFDQAVFGSIDRVYEKELGISAEAIVNLPEITFENPPIK